MDWELFKKPFRQINLMLFGKRKPQETGMHIFKGTIFEGPGYNKPVGSVSKPVFVKGDKGFSIAPQTFEASFKKKKR